MVQTLPSIDSIHNEEKVNTISINASGDKVLIGDCKGSVLLYSLDEKGQHLELPKGLGFVDRIDRALIPGLRSFRMER